MSRLYVCAWCLTTPTEHTTAAGHPICGDCWDREEDGFTPSALIPDSAVAELLARATWRGDLLEVPA